jgi:hypothetical protein
MFDVRFGFRFRFRFSRRQKSGIHLYFLSDLDVRFAGLESPAHENGRRAVVWIAPGSASLARQCLLVEGEVCRRIFQTSFRLKLRPSFPSG